MSTQQYEICDRYSLFGIERPNPKTVCLGQCEGMGFYPESDQSSPLWQQAHRDRCTPLGWLKTCWKYRNDVSFWWNVKRGWWSCDGYHFVTCPDCKGSRKREGAR